MHHLLSSSPSSPATLPPHATGRSDVLSLPSNVLPPAPAVVAPSTQKKKRRAAASAAVSPAPPKKPKLRSIAMAKSDTPVPVTPLDQRIFESWAAFDAYFEAYCSRTFQVMSSKTCVPVTSRNARVLERIAAKGEHAQHERYKLIPESFETYSRTLVCTHAGAPRRRSEGLRPNRNVRPLGCPAKLNLVVHRLRKTIDGPWCVHVTDQVATHNHAISEAQFKLYPQQRRITDPDILRTVRAMRKYGTPRRGIFEYIKDVTGREAITMRDVTNLLNKFKAEDEKEAAALVANAEGGAGVPQEQEQQAEQDEELEPEEDEDEAATTPDSE